MGSFQEGITKKEREGCWEPSQEAGSLARDVQGGSPELKDMWVHSGHLRDMGFVLNLAFGDGPSFFGFVLQDEKFIYFCIILFPAHTLSSITVTEKNT